MRINDLSALATRLHCEATPEAVSAAITVRLKLRIPALISLVNGEVLFSLDLRDGSFQPVRHRLSFPFTIDKLKAVFELLRIEHNRLLDLGITGNGGPLFVEYVDHGSHLIGLGQNKSGQWGAFRFLKDGQRIRVRSKTLPGRKSKTRAQYDLDQYAAGKGWRRNKPGRGSNKK